MGSTTIPNKELIISVIGWFIIGFIVGAVAFVNSDRCECPAVSRICYINDEFVDCDASGLHEQYGPGTMFTIQDYENACSRMNAIIYYSNGDILNCTGEFPRWNW